MSGLLTAACCGSVLIVLVLLLRLTLQNYLPRRLFPVLWYVAVLRLLLPLSIPSALSVWNLARQSPAQQGSAAVTDALLPFPAQRTADALTARLPAAPADLLRLVWLCGAVLLAGYFLIGYVRMLRRLRGRALMPDAAARDMLCRLRVARADIRVTASRRAPLTCGILHPMIFLPDDLPQTDARFALVLAHELAHVRRRDCAGKLALVLCLCLYWWNPLVLAMVLTAGRDMELACDEAVLAALGSGQKKAYALTLLDMAQRQSRAHPLSAGFSRSTAESRLRALFSVRRAPAWLGMCVLAAFLLASGALATQPLSQHESAAAPEHTTQRTPPAPAVSEPVTTPTTPEATPDTTPPADKPEAESSTAPAYIWPLDDADAVITQSFGLSVHPITKQEVTHYGIDIAVPSGTGVLAAAAGTVTECSYSPADGYCITLTHADGLQTQYAHLREFLAASGDEVAQGALIARSGASGWATGAHLHFAVLENGVYRDPLTALSAE